MTRTTYRSWGAAALGMWLAACGGKDTPKPDAAATGSQAYEQGGANVPPPAAAAGAPAAGGKRTLLILGTSLTAGLGLDPKDAYPALLEAKADSAGLAWTVVNAGLSGETSAGALRRADWVLSGPGDVVVVETGANRVKAAKPGVPVLLVQMEAPPNMGQRYTRQFHDMYAALAKEAEVPLLPFLLDGVAGVAKYNQADGIHPNEDGSKLVAANLWKALETVLRK
ncbi:MAG: arylesterase [Gemmatimonadaceae bacterium]|nr:arylesterase [Gemmatimonadaceae bacterium]